MPEPRGSKSIIAVQSKRRWGVNWLRNMSRYLFFVTKKLP